MRLDAFFPTSPQVVAGARGVRELEKIRRYRARLVFLKLGTDVVTRRPKFRFVPVPQELLHTLAVRSQDAAIVCIEERVPHQPKYGGDSGRHAETAGSDTRSGTRVTE